jgi:MFS family permease
MLDRTKLLVATVYFLQGFGIAGLAFSIFLKETLHWSVMQMTLMGTITSIPWFVKIFYGVLSDNFPLFGYRRKSWLAVASALLIVTDVILAFVHCTSFWFYTSIFFLSSMAVCMVDVITDGYVVQKSVDLKTTNQYQNLSWGSRAVGAAISSVIAGWVAGRFGIYQIFMMGIPITAIQLPFSLLLDEGRVVVKKAVALKTLVKTSLVEPVKEFVRNKQLLWIALFAFLCMFSPSFGTPFFFRMRDVLHFDAQFLGILGSIGSVGEIVGCVLFAKFLSNVSVRKLLYVAVFIWAVNTALVLAIVDKPTAIIVNVVGAVMGYISFIPTLAIAAKICKDTKYEATTFAIVCSLKNLAGQGSSLMGAWLYQYTGFFWLVVISTVTTFLVLPVIHKLDDCKPVVK